MRFPVKVNHRWAEAVIGAKFKSYPPHTAGKRILSSFSTYSKAQAKAAVKVRELSAGNPSVAQSSKASSADALVIDANRARILLVDDHAVVRYGVAQLINRQPDLVVCGEEEDAAKGFAAIAAQKPDLVIVDISLKDSSGLELIRNLKAQCPRLPILVLSVHDESVYAEVAFRAGAVGYLMKEEALEKLLTAVQRVLAGAIYVSDRLAAKMLQQQVQGRARIQESPVQSLSDRELEVLKLIGEWKQTSDIARELHLSIKTIEYYREQIKRKLKLHGAIELTHFATSWVQRGIPI